MKWLLSAPLAISLFLFPKLAFADEGWVINSFHSDITLEKSGVLSVKETINLDFGSQEKHGIFRQIPTTYRLADNSNRYVNLTYTSISQDGQEAHFDDYFEAGYQTAKIGDASRTISGPHTYQIEYVVRGALNGFVTHDEIYWNLLGNWPVKILSSQATVSVPGNSLQKVTCFVGPAASTKACESNLEESSATFTTDEVLGNGSDFSIVASIKPGTVPILTGTKPEEAGFNPFTAQRFTLVSISFFFIILALGLIFLFQLWSRHGRDLWWRRAHLFDENQKAEVQPLLDRDTLVVEFSPPENLRPAEIGTLMDERADTLDVTATIVDLASRGYLKITEVAKKWLFGSKDYMLEKKKEADEQLLGYEKELFERLFDDGQSVALSELKKTFYTDLKKVKEKLYSDLTSKKYFPQNPETVRGKYLAFGFGVFVFAALGVAFLSRYLDIVFLPSIALGILGLFLALLSPLMSRRTAAGHELYRRSRGFEMFISRAEKYRQQFFEKENLFNELLAYAIVFGCTEKFAKAFAKMGLKATEPSWYSGSGAFNALYFGAAINSFSSSLSSAIAATPAASGGSGFSASGGFSGGGFGGGGGGSW
ncbi:MAG: DUF2207 domain-containing protein [bacterium]|nr:DUF2207 domain-containing protein [bacterium]